MPLHFSRSIRFKRGNVCKTRCQLGGFYVSRGMRAFGCPVFTDDIRAGIFCLMDMRSNKQVSVIRIQISYFSSYAQCKLLHFSQTTTFGGALKAICSHAVEWFLDNKSKP